METTRIVTLAVKGRHIVIAEAEAAKYKPEAVKNWDLSHTPYTVDAAMEVGRQLAQCGVYNDAGVGDPLSIEIARCRFIAQRVMRDTDVAELPLPVLREFGRRMLTGEVITQEDLDALKNE